MKRTEIVILGGGISGLACRAALTGHDTLLLEAAEEVGGLLRMYEHGDYVFDTCVHVLFFRSAELRQRVAALLPAGLRAFPKQNAIWQRDTVVPYPYQLHTRALPAPVRDECLNALPEPGGEFESASASFEAWLVSEYGAGFVKHFFRPYNEKLYGVPLSQLAAKPTNSMFPRCDRAGIRRGALTDTAPCESVNATSTYPIGRRGIGALTDAFEKLGAGELWLGARVVQLDPVRREVTTRDGRSVRYERLVNTLPLPTLLGLANSPALADAYAHTKVTIVEIGATRSGPGLPFHWTYFPDPEIPFYRLVRLERISNDLAPPGAAAILLECQGEPSIDREVILALLERLNVLHARDVNHFRTRVLPFAYVLFTHSTSDQLARVYADLSLLGIELAGRFGRWEYASIEGAILSGEAAAARALEARDG